MQVCVRGVPARKGGVFGLFPGVLLLLLLFTGSGCLVRYGHYPPRAAAYSPQPLIAVPQKMVYFPQNYIPDTTAVESAPLAPVLLRIQTAQPVVFLGIDDGWVQSPEALHWLTTQKLPFTLFLTDDAIKGNYAYFKQLQAAGMTIQDHTIAHPQLSKLTDEQQKAEICGGADKMEGAFGKRPTLFRPPYGDYNAATRRIVSECGMKAVILWHAKVNGGSMQFQGVDRLMNGDIVLMHFRPEFMKDMSAFMAEADKQKLTVSKLEDWVR
jgi:peptidoglycan/xylan/chitin deacetylase (PgdA/CDA1 family)